jgi:hypothetical protein
MNGNPPRGYLKVNGVAYAVGEAAVIGSNIRRLNATRYDKDFIAVLMVESFTRLVVGKGTKKEPIQIGLTSLYPPGMINYTDQLRAALVGKYTVEYNGGTAYYQVGGDDLHLYDEPAAGVGAYILTASGNASGNMPSENAVVIDIGARTVDLMPMNYVDGFPQPSIAEAQSHNIGVLTSIEAFKDAIMNIHRSAFSHLQGEIPLKALETALHTGEFRGLDVAQAAQDARNMMMQGAVEKLNALGGIIRFDQILLTGGGATLLHQEFRRELVRPSGMPLDIQFVLGGDGSDSQLANVYGASRTRNLLRRMEGESLDEEIA